MAEKTFDLRGLKCPLPVLRTRKALAGMRAGDILVVACADPLAVVDMLSRLWRLRHNPQYPGGVGVWRSKPSPCI